MTKISVAEQVVKVLESRGVEYVFGVPGEEVEDLLFALERSKIRFVATRHEQGAAFMADVWGRLTGRVGVCLATLGPGATNLISGVADAYLDKAPLLAITGQAGTDRHHKDSHQYIDTAAIFRPITKWNSIIKNPSSGSALTHKAIEEAEREKPGATHIDIPEDVAEKESEYKAIKQKKEKKKTFSKSELNKAISIISLSEKPIIIGGNGIFRAGVTDLVNKICEEFNIPFVSTFMGKGAVSDDSHLSLKAAGMKAKDFQSYALEEADVVISVGYDLGEWSPYAWCKGKKVIHIDSELDGFYKSYKPKSKLVGDIRASLESLLKEMKKKKISRFDDWYKKYRDAIVEDYKSWAEGETITTPFVLDVLRRAMNKEDVLISDVGSHKMWIARNFHTVIPNTCIISNGLAAMGIALPGGVSAKLAKPSANVISVMGDGGFLMNSQEIETAKRIGANFVIVVLNDNDYGLISWKQKNSRGKSFGTKLTNPDFVKYAESFGIKAYNPKTRQAVEKDLKKAIDSGELCLVAIDIDPSVNLKLSEKLKAINFK